MSVPDGRGAGVPKLLAVNALIFVAVWTAALFLLAAGADLVSLVRGIADDDVDERALLPNYPDRDFAVRIYRDHGTAKRRYTPFIEYRGEAVHTETTNLDESGLRVHRAGRDSGPGVATLGFFGGSAMWGTGADDDHTIPGWFDQMTHGFDVRNYGDIGWKSRHNVAQLVNLANQNQVPDVVVFYDGFNDVYSACNEASGLNGSLLESRIRGWIQAGKQYGEVGLYEVFVAPFVNALRAARSREVQPHFVCDSDPARAHAVASTLVRNWQIAARLVESEGGRFHGFLQPSMYTGSPRIDRIPERYIEQWGGRSLGPQFDAVYPRIRALLADSGLAWTDLTHVLDGGGYFYVDPPHLSPNGNELVARAMVGPLEASTGQRGPRGRQQASDAPIARAQSGGVGTRMAGNSVPPSTWKTLPVTQEAAGEAR